MVFTMNTSVFAEEVALDSTDEVAVVTVDEAEAEAEAAVDAVGDAYETTGDKKLAVEYKENTTDKKKTKNVAVITNVANPLSWNILGDPGKALMETVLNGEDTDVKHIVNNNKDFELSSNDSSKYRYDNIDHLKRGSSKLSYNIIPVDKENGKFLIMGYGFPETSLDEVDGYGKIPVTAWDGRKVDFDKSGLNKYTTSKRDDLSVKVAYVEYDAEKQTATEVPGVTVAGVKFTDKKLLGKATLSGEQIDIDGTDKYVLLESGGKLPEFTFTVKVNNKDIKSDTKKAIVNAVKKNTEKYHFGISQGVISIYEFTDLIPGFYPGDQDKAAVSEGKIKDNNSYLSSGDDDEHTVGGLTVTKFTLKNGKAKANVSNEVYTWNGKKGANKYVKLKEGVDYTLKVEKLAGEDVAVLDFKGNWTYSNKDSSLSGPKWGYKWAFRQSPITEKSSKEFRKGIWKNSSVGFVYSV